MPGQPPATSKRKARALKKADFVALAELRYALRKFTAFSETAAGGCGLTPQQHQALLAIRASAHDRMTVKEIADWLLLRHHSAGELVDRLERMDMVQRIADEQDRRKVQVVLTPAAHEKLEALSSAHLEELRAAAPLLRTLLGHFDSSSDRTR